MANIQASTQWHGNPRPIESFTTTAYLGTVASPYYKDNRLVPEVITYNTFLSQPSTVPTAIIAGDDAVVFVGLQEDLDTFTISATVTGGTDIVSKIYVLSLPDDGVLPPAQTAASIAAALREDYGDEIEARSDGEAVILKPARGSSVTNIVVTQAQVN